MADQNIQEQINVLNSKMDLILEELQLQKAARIEKADLMQDLGLVGKDIFANTVQTLDRSGVELDFEELSELFIKLIRNVGAFNKLMSTFESINDLAKDVSPIIHQVGLDAIEKFAEFERRGYLEFFAELKNIADVVVENFTANDLKMISGKIVPVLDMVKNLMNSGLLESGNNAVKIYSELQTKETPSYSMWQAMKAMKTPEMKKAIGFMMTFMQELAKHSFSNKT